MKPQVGLLEQKSQAETMQQWLGSMQTNGVLLISCIFLQLGWSSDLLTVFSVLYFFKFVTEGISVWPTNCDTEYNAGILNNSDWM